MVFNSPLNDFMAKTNIIHKPNELIHIMPTLEQRVSGTMRLLYNAIILLSQQMGKQDEYIAVLNDVLQLCNLSSDFRTVKKIFKDIRRLDFEWRYIDDLVDETIILGLIDEPRFIARKGYPTIVTWKLNSLIQDRLLDPAMFFTRINLEMMTKLTKSGASLALYEICARYLTNNRAGGPGRTGKHSLDWWMPRIVGSLEYKPEYKFLKRDFIKPAMEEINKLTELNVELHEFKFGRTVREIEFTITKKTNTSVKSESNRIDNLDKVGNDRLFERVLSFGIKEEIANDILEKYKNSDYVDRHIDGLEIAFKKGKVKSPAAWLNTSLANNWDHPSFNGDSRNVSLRDNPKQTRIIAEKKLKNEIEVETSVASTEEKSLAYSKFEELADNLKLELINKFLEITNGFVRSEYSKKKLKSSLFLVSFKQWLVKDYQILDQEN